MKKDRVVWKTGREITKPGYPGDTCYEEMKTEEQEQASFGEEGIFIRHPTHM